MSNKDNRELLPMRIGIGVILLIVLLLMFVVNPGENTDKFSNETLWEAVHPWNAIKDTIALIALIGFSLLLTGYLGKFFNIFTTMTPETAKAIGIICGLAMILFFV